MRRRRRGAPRRATTSPSSIQGNSMTRPPETCLEYHRPETSTLRQILLRWEKFRIIYNILLIAVAVATTALAHPRNMTDPDFWLAAALAGLLANICFCLGPFV